MARKVFKRTVVGRLTVGVAGEAEMADETDTGEKRKVEKRKVRKTKLIKRNRDDTGDIMGYSVAEGGGKREGGCPQGTKCRWAN